MYDNKPSMFRFLQARQWDLEKAATMYRNHMEWRKREELDTWLPTPSGPMPKLLIEFYFPEIAEVKRYYPFCYHKMTKEGRPIYFDRLGAIEYKNMIKNSSPERVLKYFTWFAEASQQYRNPAASLVCGKHIGKSHFIIDMKGFGISKLNSETRKFISDFSKIASDNYPECMHKTWIINAPFIFQTAWAMVKNMLDPQTVAKFSIMGGERDYMPKLLQLMDKKDIPTFCGGADDTYDPCKEIGPWADLMPSSQGPLH